MPTIVVRVKRRIHVTDEKKTNGVKTKGPRSKFQCHGTRGMLPHGTVTGGKRGTDTGVVCLVDLE